MTPKKTASTKRTPKKKRVATPKGDPIDVAIRNFEKNLKTEQLKLADYLRLLQVKKDREGNQPRQITVRWIESWEKEPAKET